MPQCEPYILNFIVQWCVKFVLIPRVFVADVKLADHWNLQFLQLHVAAELLDCRGCFSRLYVWQF